MMFSRLTINFQVIQPQNQICKIYHLPCSQKLRELHCKIFNVTNDFSSCHTALYNTLAMNYNNKLKGN